MRYYLKMFFKSSKYLNSNKYKLKIQRNYINQLYNGETINKSIYNHVPKLEIENKIQQNIIFLHGFLGSKNNFKTLANYINKIYGHESYSIDAPNHGSNNQLISEYNYDIMMKDIIDFIKNKNLHSINIVGHSMGGKTACYIALNYPHLIKSLIIIDILPIKTSFVIKF